MSFGRPYVWCVNVTYAPRAPALLERLVAVAQGCLNVDYHKRLTVPAVLDMLAAARRDFGDVPSVFAGTPTSASVGSVGARPLPDSAAVGSSGHVEAAPPPAPAAVGSGGVTTKFCALDIIAAAEALSEPDEGLVTRLCIAIGGLESSTLDVLKTPAVAATNKQVLAVRKALATASLNQQVMGHVLVACDVQVGANSGRTWVHCSLQRLLYSCLDADRVRRSDAA